MKIARLLVFMFFSLSGQKPVGLKNLGNTCFQNASLQCMYTIEKLTDFLIMQKKNDTGYYRKDTLAQAYTDLVDLLRKITGVGAVKPEPFCGRAWKEFFSPEELGEQQDAHQFTNALLNRLADEDVNSKEIKYYGYPVQNRVKTFVHELFDIFSEDTLVCLECNEKKVSFGQLLILTLAVKAPGKSLASVEECLNHFVARETLTGDEQIYCERCGKKSDAHKSLRLFTAPQYCIIHLGRGLDGKVSDAVKIPLHLDARPFFSAESYQAPAAEYELIGITIHVGTTVRSGHYYAYVKAADTKWYRADDSTVSDEVPLSDIQKFQTQGYLDYQSATPYLLFYKRTQALPAKDHITTKELRQKLQQAGITQQRLNNFLAQETKERKVATTLQTLVDGVNQGFITRERIVEDIQRFEEAELQRKLKKDLVFLDVSLQALTRSLTP